MPSNQIKANRTRQPIQRLSLFSCLFLLLYFPFFPCVFLCARVILLPSYLLSKLSLINPFLSPIPFPLLFVCVPLSFLCILSPFPRNPLSFILLIGSCLSPHPAVPTLDLHLAPPDWLRFSWVRPPLLLLPILKSPWMRN